MNKKMYSILFVLGLIICLIGTSRITSAQIRRGVTEDTIKLGEISYLTGAAAILGQNVVAAIDAYFKWVNEQGGIHGRKIKLFVEDNKWEAHLALAAGKKLIYQDNVLAFVSSCGTVPMHGIFDFINAEKVPTLPYSYSRTMYEPFKKYVFSFLTAYNFQAAAGIDFIVQNLKDAKPEIGVITVEGDAGNDFIDGAQAAAKYYKFKIAATQTFPQNAVDYSSQVFNLKRADVKYVLMMGSPQHSGTILDEMAKLGWNPIFVFTDCAFSTKLPELCPNIKGAYMISVMLDYEEDVPSMQKVKEITQKYSTFKPSAISYLVGWTKAEIMTAALRKAGKDLNVESLMRGLESLKSEPMAAIGPITYSASKHSTGGSYRIVQIDPGLKAKFKVLEDWRKTTSVSE